MSDLGTAPEAADGHIDLSGDDKDVAKLAGLLSGTATDDGDTEFGTQPGAEDADGPLPTESDPAEAGEDGAAETPSTEKDDGEDEAPAPPAVQPPQSWDAEAKELFAQLPPAIQAKVLERESQRDNATNARLREAAELRRSAEAERHAAAQERAAYAARLPTLIDQNAKAFAGEFPDIQTMDDLQALAAKDPARAIRFQTGMQALQLQQAEAQQLQARAQQESEVARQQHLADQFEKLKAAAPEFLDEKTAPAQRAKAKSYLQSIGYAPGEVDQITDHRVLLVVRDAMAYRAQSQAAKSAVEKKVVNVPRVASPRPVDQGGGARRQQAAMAVARKGGSTESIAAALADLIDME